MLDIVIRNGRIVDGTGNPWYRADIGISKGKVATIGKHLPDAAAVIDAADMIVCPGFIDIHGHSDLTLLSDPLREFKIRQGITTEVNGNCGISAAPTCSMWSDFLHAGMVNHELEYSWRTFAEYLDVISKVPTALNVVSLVGYNTIRASAAGLGPNLSPSELEQCSGLVVEALEAGAFGLSTGLVYEVGSSTSLEELVEICKVVAHYGAIYTTHCRGLRETFVESTIEALEIGRRSGVSVHISHHTPQYGGWGKSRVTVPLIEEARARGIDATMDLHLDTVGATGILDTLPPWTKERGVEGLVNLLKSNDIRWRIKNEMLSFIGPGTSGFIKNGRWDLLYLVGCQANKDLIGLTFSEIGKRRGIDPHDAYLDICVEERGQAQVGAYYTPEEDIEMVIRSPISSIGTDAIGPQEHLLPPPRTYGTFPRVLAEYVRGKKVLTLEEAIRKMTSANARRLGLSDRGLIREGFWADILVFDDAKIGPSVFDEDFLRGQPYSEPYPNGIKYLIVNGEVVLHEGVVTGTLPGKVLRRE